MEFSVGVGKSDFAQLRMSGNYYVDKTDFIYELVNETDNTIALFTRPRRFGKTLMMSMMENFFNIDKDSREIFNGLAIARHADFCREWQNQYPVLFISFKDAESDEFDIAYAKLKTVIADVCKKIPYITDSESVNEGDKQIFERLKMQTGTESDVQNSLKAIMRMMRAVHGKPAILLIDEYDVPLARANENDAPDNRYYRKMLNVIRGIMSAALKDNEYLKFAVITGCLRIAKESIFTGTNNFVSYSVLDEDFSDCFGFTESEVEAMLTAADRREKAETVKAWYNGYVFGGSRVYCPWDVVNYLSALKKRRDAAPKCYWKNTSHNGILLTFAKRTDFKVKGKFETLLNGGAIVQTITDALTYDALHASEDNLWSVLLMTGYVTKADADEDGETVQIKIPNKEIATIFEDAVVTLFKDTIDNGRQKSMMAAFWELDAEGAGRAVSELLWKTISYNDYHEDYYHAFLTGVFTGLGYEVESNKEKGLGRPDILLKDEDNRRALIIEAKKAAKETDMDKLCDKALAQIADKKYAEGLYGYEQVFCYGIAFFQKQAKVKGRLA